MGVEKTKGHVQGNGGLRGHSVGDVFPCVIYQQGTFDDLYYRVLYPDGTGEKKYRTYEAARDAARMYLGSIDE